MTGGEVRLDGLVKRYGDVVAVDGVFLQVGAGEFFSLLGPSGCGKTTTRQPARSCWMEPTWPGCRPTAAR